MASSSEDPEDLVVLESSGYAHGAPPEGLECAATYEDITAEDENYVEYQTAPSGAWHAAKYAEETVCRFIRVQFDEYVAGVRKADCEADLRRRIGKGPPIWLADKHALPVPDDDTHACRLWLARTGREYSAKLKGALEGDAVEKNTEVVFQRVPKELDWKEVLVNVQAAPISTVGRWVFSCRSTWATARPSSTASARSTAKQSSPSSLSAARTHSSLPTEKHGLSDDEDPNSYAKIVRP